MAPRVYACLYIRKSNETEEQKSLKDQISEGRDFCERKGWILRDEHIFVDEESAYLKPAEKREAFIDMVDLAVAKKPPFTKVVVWKVDRFARRTQDGFKYWQMLADNDVELFSMTQTFGEGAGGKLNLGIHFMMAEYYSDELSDNVKRGVRGSSLKGYWTSWRVPYGYERLKDDSGNYRLQIKVEEESVVKEVFELAIKGWGAKRIAAKLQDDGLDFKGYTVHKILKNEHYTGDRVIRNRAKNKILLRIPDTHPPIVSKSTYQKANRSMRSRARERKKTGVGDSLYSGILKCRCGRLLHRNQNGGAHGKYVYWRCDGKKWGSGCVVGNVREDRITELVLNLVRDKIFSDDAMKEMYKLAEMKRKHGDLEKATRHLNRQLAENKSKQRNLIEMVRDGIIEMSEIKDDMHQLKADADALEAKLDFAPEQRIKPGAMKKLVAQLERDLYKDGPARRDAMRELVKEIVVDLPQIHVTTSLMAVEDTYDFYYFTPPQVPKDYRSLSARQKRLLTSDIKRFVGDPRHRGSYFDKRERPKPIKTWTAKELDDYIEQYTILRNETLCQQEETKDTK